ncbi:MAG TPA: DUF4079 family protein [Thermodesulfovibrionales bacterium]|nr:DUF4079 family protein [Thermodesulfovibrionales bacterium]
MIVYLKLLHGLYNILIFLFFLYQGWLGFIIRRRRRKDMPPDFTSVKRHRKSGPLLVVLGCLGYLAGLVLVLADSGHIVKYPLHFTGGSLLAILLVGTHFTSRKIKGPDSPFRNSHAIIGVMILSLSLSQIFLGVRILF